jgi:DNA helicase-2/ATP-dependent DNA helicase PcrA
MSQDAPSNDLLEKLTFAQKDAVMHREGPLLILAGPGSGKTRVITRRVAWMLQEGVRASNILAITFTNKAASEMKQRVEQLVPGNRVWISTFHALGAKLLRIYGDRIGLDKNFTIYDMDDRNRVIKNALAAAGIDSTRFSPERIGSAISKAKNQLLTPDRYASTASDFFTQTVAQTYGMYQKQLRDANGLDFDDLLYIPALILKTNEELRAELDERFRYVMIDEYQDTNQAQYEIAKRLSIDHRNLCVVGDPDQSIYRWRGSDIRNILDFERDFPDARVITLDKNYRSTKAILHAAGTLIEKNSQRKKRALITDNPQGEPVKVLTFDDGLDEAGMIAKRIREAVQNGRRYRDFAVFVRINALTRTLESAFIKEGIPFQIVKGLAFFERKENKDILAYVRLLVNPLDNISFLRVVNEPSRGIGKTSLEHLSEYAEQYQLPLLAAAGEANKIKALKGKALTGLQQFFKLIHGLREKLEQPPDVLIRAVIEETGYRESLQSSDNEEDQDRLANIEELITAARQFAEQDATLTIRDFLEQVTLASDVDGYDERQDCVSMMTLHAAKGLEFPVVYMVAVEEGILPHSRAMESRKPEEIEEERRLCFVGMTRAMHELFLSHAKTREFRGSRLDAISSGFLRELPEEIERIDHCRYGSGGSSFDRWRGSGLGWQEAGVSNPKPIAKPSPPVPDESGYFVGQIVVHDQYGIGSITEISGLGALKKLKIRFGKGGEKSFIANMVKLKVVPPRGNA